MNNRFRKEPGITQKLLKNGKWSFQVRIRDDEHDITKSFKESDYGSAREAFNDAIIYRNTTLTQINQGTVLKRNVMTVNDVFEEYMGITTLSHSTKMKHRKLYGKYISHKSTLIQKLTRADILEDLNSMVNEATDGTLQRVYSIYKNDIVEYAMAKEYIIKNLTIAMQIPKSRVISVKKDTSTDRETILEVERLLLSSNVNPHNVKMIVNLIELLYYTGMRPAEAEALLKTDIHDGYISVTKQLGSDADDYDVVTRCKTNSSIRNVPIHPSLRPVLEELLDGNKPFLFYKDDGHYMNSTFVCNVLRRVLKGTGIKFNLYRLRHNMATELVKNGTDTKTTMELLGHSNYSMSLGYANSSDKRKEDAIKLFS